LQDARDDILLNWPEREEVDLEQDEENGYLTDDSLDI
jgi:hypothetical protein